MDFSSFFSNIFVKVIFILLVAKVLHHISARVIDRVVRHIISSGTFETKLDSKKREDTIGSIFRAAAGFVIWLVTAVAILGTFRFNLASIVAGAGFFGIIIGLGAQATIRDYVAGVFILIENQYRVGDIVTLHGGTTGLGTSGVVEEISFRITKLRDLDGTLNIVRNGEATIITNRTFKYSSVVLDISVDYDSDIDMVEKIMNEVGDSMLKDPLLGEDIEEPISFLRVESFGESAVIVKALGKVKPAKQWDMAGEYRRRLLKAFAKHKIKIALPRLIVEQK